MVALRFAPAAMASAGTKISADSLIASAIPMATPAPAKCRDPIRRTDARIAHTNNSVAAK